MAFHETYQVYNRQNKQFVKMRNGQILESSYFRYEEIPLFGEAPAEDPEPAGTQESQQKEQPKNDTTDTNSNSDEGEHQDDDSLGVGAF